MNTHICDFCGGNVDTDEYTIEDIEGFSRYCSKNCLLGIKGERPCCDNQNLVAGVTGLVCTNCGVESAIKAYDTRDTQPSVDHLQKLEDSYRFYSD